MWLIKIKLSSVGSQKVKRPTLATAYAMCITFHLFIRHLERIAGYLEQFIHCCVCKLFTL